MHIASVGRALPSHRYEQDELLEAFTAYWTSTHHNPRRVEQLHNAVQVGARHLALPLEAYPELTFGRANQAFVEVGTEVGATAVTRALEAAGLEPTDVDAIFATTVTGIATPSLDARLVNRLGLRTDVKRTPIFGLGCVAGAAGIARMHDYLKAYPDQAAVLLSVELCSLTLQRHDLSIPNLIATGLFGDGGAAVVGVGAERAEAMGLSGPRVVRSRSRFYPDTERVMGWDVTDTGLQIVLSAGVPEMVTRHIADDVDAFLADAGLSRDAIDVWVCHPGGPKVVTAYRDALGIEDADVQLTWDSLQSVGNLSSASVLFILGDTLETRDPAPGSHGVLLAMGPGFCSELVQLQW